MITTLVFQLDNLFNLYQSMSMIPNFDKCLHFGGKKSTQSHCAASAFVISVRISAVSLLCVCVCLSNNERRQPARCLVCSPRDARDNG